MRTTLVIIALVLGASSCTPASAAEDETRYSGLACDHFRNIVGDTTAGVLTDAELRTKLSEVRGDSSIATAQIQAASTAMLAAATAGDADALTAAVLAMDAGCRATSN